MQEEDMMPDEEMAEEMPEDDMDVSGDEDLDEGSEET